MAAAPTVAVSLKEARMPAVIAVAASGVAISTAVIAALAADIQCTATASAARAEVRAAASADLGIGVQAAPVLLPEDGEEDRKLAAPMRQLRTATGIRSPASVVRSARHLPAIISVAAAFAVSARAALATLAGVAAGVSASAGDLAGDGDGISGARSGNGQGIGIARGGAGTDITTLLTLTLILTERRFARADYMAGTVRDKRNVTSLSGTQ